MTLDQIKECIKEVLEESNTEDVSEWARDEWEKAKQLGIISGFNQEGTDYRPKAYLTREQLVIMIMKALGHSEPDAV